MLTSGSAVLAAARRSVIRSILPAATRSAVVNAIVADASRPGI
jgi:hypothetical protein